MSTEENKAVIRCFTEAGNRHDLEAGWEYVDPQCRVPALTKFGLDTTSETYKTFLGAYYAALPDVSFTIKAMVAEEENVWVHFIMSGTHEGLLRNIPATHKRVTYSQIAMYRVVNGKIVELDTLTDDATLLRQLGALPG